MSIPYSSISLRNLLLFDAATCALMGIALVLGTQTVAAWTAIPPSVLSFAGALLLPIAIFMIVVAMRALHSAPAVWLIIIGNWFWVAASLALLLRIAPNAIGFAFVVAQAVAVAVLATLEYGALRRAPSPLTA